ncbi:MAG: zinc ribbon domain-containing protein [Nitrosospira sp.]|nr:zinc ribbon domain-containing protein [Nitrosospira sp.]
MPIYEYRCGSCNFEKEYLQKVSDAPIAVCPACGSDAYAKLISAAGFQLKGSGWYATDFKTNTQPKSKPDAEACAPAPNEKTATPAACPACPAD